MEASWYVRFLAAILVFKIAAAWDLYSAISREGRHLESSKQADCVHERTLEVYRLT